MDSRYLADLGGLTVHRRIIFADARAAGRSAVPDDRTTVSFTAQARDVESLRRHLQLDRIDVLAHSAGCLTAQEHAARFTGTVRRLVLVAPVGRAAREPDPAELAALRASRHGEPWYTDSAEADRLLREGAAASEQAMLQARLTPFYWHRWSAERRAEYVPGHATPLPWLRDAFYAGSATADTAAQRLARLAASRVPVLVLAGASDGMSGTAPARAVAECHSGGRLEIMPGSGHRPWVEEPGLFRELVTGFLDG